MKNELFKMAKQALINAYAPYSKFHVAAALVTDKQNIYTGCNIENASYGLSLCAEAVTIAHMVNAGERYISQIAIIGNNEAMISPCGACRQRILEFCDQHTQIHLCSSSQVMKTLSISELLPYHFGPEHLIEV